MTSKCGEEEKHPRRAALTGQFAGGGCHIGCESRASMANSAGGGESHTPRHQCLSAQVRGDPLSAVEGEICIVMKLC